MGSKGKIISGSSGSLLSSGKHSVEFGSHRPENVEEVPAEVWLQPWGGSSKGGNQQLLRRQLSRLARNWL